MSSLMNVFSPLVEKTLPKSIPSIADMGEQAAIAPPCSKGTKFLSSATTNSCGLLLSRLDDWGYVYETWLGTIY